MRLRTQSRILLAIAAVMSLTTGCATKKDFRQLEESMAEMRNQQGLQLQMILQSIKQENAASRDSLKERMVRMEGDLKRELLLTNRQLARLEELSGHGQQSLTDRIRELNAQLESIRRERERAAMDGTDGADASRATSAPCPALSDAPRMLDLTRQLLRKQPTPVATARIGAQEYLRCFADQPGTPEAGLLLAETFVLENRHEEALKHFARVVELHPASPQAATAIYRQGAIEAERKNKDTARKHFQKVKEAYPSSQEARLAEEALKKLGK